MCVGGGEDVTGGAKLVWDEETYTRLIATFIEHVPGVRHWTKNFTYVKGYYPVRPSRALSTFVNTPILLSNQVQEGNKDIFRHAKTQKHKPKQNSFAYFLGPYWKMCSAITKE